MTIETFTLAEFLSARIAEDELTAAFVAERANPRWATPSTATWLGDPSGRVEISADRMLRECAAKRVALERYKNDDDAVMHAMVVALASAYADHPDFDPVWA